MGTAGLQTSATQRYPEAPILGLVSSDQMLPGPAAEPPDKQA